MQRTGFISAKESFFYTQLIYFVKKLFFFSLVLKTKNVYISEEIIIVINYIRRLIILVKLMLPKCI